MRITATVTFAGMALLVFGILHITFLKEFTGGEEMTGTAISLIVLGSILMFISGPEFFRLKGDANLLNELMGLTSEAELRRRRSEGDSAADELGGGWQERWDEFLSGKGLKRRR